MGDARRAKAVNAAGATSDAPTYKSRSFHLTIYVANFADTTLEHLPLQYDYGVSGIRHRRDRRCYNRPNVAYGVSRMIAEIP